MVLIESTELLENLSLLLKMSREFKMHEMSQAYENAIHLVEGMYDKVDFEYFYSQQACESVIN